MENTTDTHVEAGEIPVGGLFHHDGQTWVRLYPDPDREDDRPVILAARLTGDEDGRGVPRPMFARAWVKPVG